MDKQFIEEMAMNRYKKHILFSERKKLADEYEEWVNKPLEDGSKIKDCALSVITFMTSKGYRKIPEGAVVLTKEEWESYCATQEGLGEIMDREREIGRKETAEKFAEMAKEGAFTDFMGEPIIRASKIDEICKELTGGK